MDVLRDLAVLDLNRNQVRVLTENLRATTQLYEAGDLTRTDIAQSDARLSSAKAQLALAQSRLAVSEESFLRVVGKRPEALASPPAASAGFRATASEAARVAMARNPRLTAALQQARAAGLDVKGDLLRPPADPGGRAWRGLCQLCRGRARHRRSAAPACRPPSASPPASRSIRAARPPRGSARRERPRASCSSRPSRPSGWWSSNARSAFVTYQAALKAIQSNQDAVSANELALRGTRAERSVGSRTVIEVLNAEQELLGSQVAADRRPPRCLCCGIPPAAGDGPGQLRGSGDRRAGRSTIRRAIIAKVAGDWSDWGGAGKHQVRSTRPWRWPKRRPTALPMCPALPRTSPIRSADVKTAPTPVALAAPPPHRPPRSLAAVPSGGRWAIQLGAFGTPGAPQALFAKVASRIGAKEADLSPRRPGDPPAGRPLREPRRGRGAPAAAWAPPRPASHPPRLTSSSRRCSLDPARRAGRRRSPDSAIEKDWCDDRSRMVGI